MTPSAYQRELTLPLISGIHEDPPWTTFMRCLLQQTYARRAFLIISFAGAMPSQEPAIVHVAASRAAHEPPLDFNRIAGMGLNPYGLMRPERVYALEEMLDHGDLSQRNRQRELLHEMGINYGRWLRISAPGFADAWLLLVREREDFSGFASSLLSSIVPHFAVALKTFVALSEQRLAAAIANRALKKIGIGQLAFDSAGRVIAADPNVDAFLSFLPDQGAAAGRRLQVLPDVACAINLACAELTSGSPDSRRLICLDAKRSINMLMRPSDLQLGKLIPNPSVIGIIETGVPETSPSAVQMLSALYGLSQNEASLAYGLTKGETIEEAGRRLHLTPATARVYSKRIYAKTGTKGQTSLVALLMSSLARFI